jgi:hypothetical protein
VRFSRVPLYDAVFVVGSSGQDEFCLAKGQIVAKKSSAKTLLLVIGFLHQIDAEGNKNSVKVATVPFSHQPSLSRRVSSRTSEGVVVTEVGSPLGCKVARFDGLHALT